MIPKLMLIPRDVMLTTTTLIIHLITTTRYKLGYKAHDITARGWGRGIPRGSRMALLGTKVWEDDTASNASSRDVMDRVCQNRLVVLSGLTVIKTNTCDTHAQ